MSKYLHLCIFKISSYGNFQTHVKIEKNNGPYVPIIQSQ